VKQAFSLYRNNIIKTMLNLSSLEYKLVKVILGWELVSEKLMIIVTGTSATGKTTLSKNLSSKFNLPVINKDEIKELLFDFLGTKDEEWALKLGMSSFELSYLFAGKLCQTGKAFIIEGNFENKYAAKTFTAIKSKYNYRVLQIYCHAQVDVLYTRYMNRDSLGHRHPGHIIYINGYEEFKNRIYNKNFKLAIEESISVDVDATRFEIVNIKQIYCIVDECLKFI
jgi:deoxyadenosine/deoxycytidine kinase